MSGSREREKRREMRLQEDADVAAGDRRKRLVQLVSGAIFLVIVVVAAVIVVSQSESGGGDSNLEDVSLVKGQLKGIPQNDLVLGSPSAPVKVVEFGDLQCPVCKAYSEEVVPQIIEGPVRSGEAKIEFRNFIVIGEQSYDAGAAAIAAGKQGRGWNYIELFYRNQGVEDSGYVTDEFLTSIARGAGVPNMSKWNADRKSKGAKQQVSRTAAEAERIGFSGTPSFGVEGPGTNGFEPLGLPNSAGELETAIREAG
ncbi:MAG TPA: thioredoxin domain-containing protein [Solirubrobacterales bacterium]|nr:thioredoxin domain-containing protein [Solirubrobacterales bacterium]